MPTYTYECACGHTFDQVLRMHDYTLEYPCPRCRETARRIYKPIQISVFTPFVTSDITGEPVEISSRRTENALCKEHGVTPVTKDDLTGRRKRPQPKLKETFRETFERIRHEKGIQCVLPN
jgi:putative FmdB family regulatory protein